MTISVITRAKNEHSYINSFINHYLNNLKFDSIYIFLDNNDSYNIINPNVKFIKHNLIGLEILSKIYNYLPNTIKWLFYCDIDEYLILPNNINIKMFINKHPINTEQILISWIMIENINSVKKYNNFKDIFLNNNLHINNKYKSIFKFGNHFLNEHVTICNNTYYNYIQYNESLTGKLSSLKYYKQNKNNAYLIHFHTRCLENVVIKSLTFEHCKNIENVSKYEFSKLKLAKKHMRKNIFDKNMIDFPNNLYINQKTEIRLYKNLLKQHNLYKFNIENIKY